MQIHNGHICSYPYTTTSSSDIFVVQRSVEWFTYFVSKSFVQNKFFYFLIRSRSIVGWLQKLMFDSQNLESICNLTFEILWFPLCLHAFKARNLIFWMPGMKKTETNQIEGIDWGNLNGFEQGTARETQQAKQKCPDLMWLILPLTFEKKIHR